MSDCWAAEREHRLDEQDWQSRQQQVERDQLVADEHTRRHRRRRRRVQQLNDHRERHARQQQRDDVQSESTSTGKFAAGVRACACRLVTYTHVTNVYQLGVNSNRLCSLREGRRTCWLEGTQTCNMYDVGTAS